ncbi:hypothetical protein ACQ86E_04375 [Bradyrhizobium betae]|uniref:hypothetical protein n=1 Tax=Bradyrhizobium betae TaxID=244734 RepID=UPI003D66ADC0
MTALFTVLTGIALIWTTITYLHVSNAVNEYLPPQFQDYENSRYAFSEWALRHPTPLSVQAEYVRFVKGSIFMWLGGGLAPPFNRKAGQYGLRLRASGGFSLGRVFRNQVFENLRAELQEGRGPE